VVALSAHYHRINAGNAAQGKALPALIRNGTSSTGKAPQYAMKYFTKLFFCCFLILVCASSGCTNNNLENETTTSTPIANQDLSTAMVDGKFCPIPPINYEKIPGYNPGNVNPSRSQKPIEIISPTLSGNPTFYLGILQQPVRFCGTAQGTIVKVKLFATGAYLYEKKARVPNTPELLLGETPVKRGIWFFSYNFREVGNRSVIAKGYDSKGQEVATSPEISITLAEPNPS
jgi:hypothetical protein